MPAAHAGGRGATRNSWNACGGMPKGGACLHAGPLYAGPSGGRAAQGSGDVFANGRACDCGPAGCRAAGAVMGALADLALLQALEACDGSVAQLTALYEQLSGERA